MGRPIRDFTGQRFGMLIVTGIAGRTPGGSLTFHCRCDCGKEIIVRGGEFSKAHPQKGCGCRHPSRIDPNRSHKLCPDCKTILPIDRFVRSKGAPDGHGLCCRSCHCQRVKNRPHRRERMRNYMRHKRATDPSFRIACSLRGRIIKVLQGISKRDHTIALLGCSANELKIYLESLWSSGMSWDNYGSYKGNGFTTWQIDHIRPCASFDLTDPEQQKQCFHYTNLQPLWSKDNLSKHANIH